jgi:putative membrane protein
MKTGLRLLLVALGLALFGWFVHRAGPGEILRALQSLNGWAPLVLAPYALVYLWDTLGWHFAFAAATPHRLPFRALFRVRWAGETVNNVFPSATIGGEAVKVYLLRKRRVPVMVGTASVVTGKTVQTLAQVMFIALGALAALPHLPAGSPVRYGTMAIAAVAFGLVGLLFWLQSHGMFSTLVAVLRRVRLHIRLLEEQAHHLRELDNRIFRFYHKDRRRFFLSLVCYLSGWVTDMLEILLVSHLLGAPVEWTQALAIEAFISVARVLGLFVPGALGVQDSGVVLLFHLFGLSPALGISYAIIRRGREVVYALAGGLLLFAEETALRGLAHKVEEATHAAK